jgi:uncharacterized RmlC-like cupin family protein
LVRLGTEIESPQTGERLTFLSTADSSGGELFRAELTMRAGDYVVRSHVHPKQEETFVVLEGRWGWKRGRETGVAEEGETVTIPAGVLLPEVGDFIRPASPPLFLQGPLFATLAVIARRRGYRARYPEYALPTAR